MRLRLAVTFLLLATPCLASAPVERPARAVTTLRVEVSDAATGMPLPGSVVSLIGGPSVVTRTGGAVEITGLPCASPYRAVNVTVRAAGYDQVLWRGIRLYTNDTTIVPFRMTRAGRLQVTDEPVHGLEVPNRLRDDTERPPPEEPGGGIEALLGPEPLYIRVLRVAKSAAAGYDIVDNVLFEDYVKGVVPKEWYTTWNAESLKAGCVAARTYGWYYVLHPKYPSRGADLTDNTSSQVYGESRVASTNSAADATRSQALTYNGAIISAEYSAENADPTTYGGVPYKPSVADPVCAGQTLYGHGRGLCQWGSQRWAIGATGSGGAKAYDWILSHYYSSSTLLQTAGDGLAVGDCAAVESGSAQIKTAPSGSLIGSVPSGTVVHLLGGPTVYNGLTYWQVEWPMPTPTRNDGWMTNQMLVETVCPVRGVAISGIAVGNVTDTTATIRWTTDVSATTVVHYGVLTTSLGQTGTGPAGTSHEVLLSGLTPSKTYYFTVESSASGLLTNVSAVQNFTTAATLLPLNITGFSVQSLAETSATLFWQTDQPSDTTAAYGASADALNQSAAGLANTLFHSVVLPGLAPDTTYYVQGKSTAPGYAPATSAVLSLRTNAPVLLTNIAAGNIQSDSVTISWTLNAPLPVSLSYGTTSGQLDFGDSVSAGVTSLDIYGLQPDTQYYYSLFVSAQGHADVTSPEMAFRTATIGTVVISGATVSNITHTGATVSWACSPSASGTVRYGPSAGPPFAHSASDAPGTVHSINLTGLAPGQDVHYSVESAAKAYTTAMTLDAVFTTLALRGDVDNDGAVTVADAVSALQIAMGGSAADAARMARAEVATPFDGQVQVSDGVVILRVAMGLISLP